MLQGVTAYKPSSGAGVSPFAGAIPSQGASNVTWAYEENQGISEMINAIMPLIMLMMMMGMMMPMMKSISEGSR